MEKNDLVETFAPLFRPSRPKFNGELAEPLEPIVESMTGEKFGVPFPTNDLRKRAKTIHRKLGLVMSHYGLDTAPMDKRDRLLAYYLLRDFVPGFQVADPNAPGRGRNAIWTTLRLSFLLSEMEAQLRLKGGRLHNEKSAASALAKREPWKSLCKDTEDPAETLRKRFQAAKRLRRSSAVLTAFVIAAMETAGNLPKGTYAEELAALKGEAPTKVRFI